MDSYGNNMFLSQEGYASIDFTLLDRPSSSISSAPESTAALLPDSSFPSFDFLDGSGVDSFGGVIPSAQEAHFRDQGRSGLHNFQEKTLHASSADMYRQGGGNQEPKLSSPQFHIPVSQVDFFSTKESGSDDLQAQLSTSGNEVADEVHDFFEQENLSQQQSQLGRGNWSVLNNNAWLPAGSNPNVIKSQPRNQPLTFDGLLNGPLAGQPRANQTTSAGDAGTPEQRQSSVGSLAGPETQQGNIAGKGSNHSRNSSEGLENIEAPINYDFLGSQLHLKGQSQAGIQHHGARQQPVLDDMQIWKQQYSYQHHLHELHRQQQAQQLEQHARQQQAQQLEHHARQQHVRQQQTQKLEQHVRQQQAQQLEQQARQQQVQQLEQRARQQQAQQLEQQARQQQVQQLEQHARQQHQLQQLLVSEKQNLGNQYSTSLYGSSIHDVSNFMRSGGLMPQMGIESQNPSLLSANFQPFNVGNMNWMPNGLPSLQGYPSELLLSQDPNLAFQALALMGTHLDPSVYGSSIANLRDAVSQPLHLYPSPPLAVQELAEGTNKAASATSRQGGKPVARTVGLGVPVLGDHHAMSFDPTSAQNDDSSGKQQALCKSLFGQTFPQNFLQPIENNRGLSNFQGTSVPRNLQVQEIHAKQQHRSWNEDAGHKDNFQVGPSHVFANSDAPPESVFYNSQQSGWQSAHVSQALAGSDVRAQSINAGQYANQGGCQVESSEFLNNLASKQRGSWSALMQSALADSSTVDAEQDDWGGVNLQKSESACPDSLQLPPGAKQQSIWGEQNVQASTSLNGRSFHLFNEVNVRPGVHSVQNLQQTSSELGSQQNNQSRLQSGASSQFVQDASGQSSGLQNQSLHQRPQVASNRQSYSDIEDRLPCSWKTQNTEPVPSEGRVSSSHCTNFMAKQQNSSWRQYQGNSETESYRMLNLSSNEESCWNKNEAQETEQNNLLLNANQRSQNSDNENATRLENEQLGSVVQNGEEQSHQTRYQGDKDTVTSVQLQDAKLKACQTDQVVHQEVFRMGIFPQNINASNLQNNSERQRQMTEGNYQLDGSKNATLDSLAKSKGIESASIYQQNNSSGPWNSYSNNSDNATREAYGMGQAKYGQNDSMTTDQIPGKVDPSQQSAKAGSDYPRNNLQRECDLQSVSNVNQRGQSRLSRMTIGSLANSGNELLRMPSRQIFQQPVGSVSFSQWHAENPKQDSALRGGVSHMEIQGQKVPGQTDFGQENMVGTFPSNNPLNTEKDVLSTKSPMDLKERPEVGHLKDISSAYVSTSSAALNRSTNFVGANKPTSLASQNILDFLSKPDHLSESDALKGTVCSEQDASVGLCESSASDISLAHFRHTQSSSPLSPRGFGLRLAPPSQLLQILQHGRSLQLNTASQEAKGLSDKQTYPSKEDSGQACPATGQDSSSKVMEPPAKADGLGRSSSMMTLAQQLNSGCELSPTVQKDRVADGTDKSSDIGASNMHPSKIQLQYMDHMSAATGQLMSTIQSPVPRVVTQRQIMHGNYFPSTNQFQSSLCVSVPGQLTATCQVVTPSTVSSVNTVTERESEIQGTYSSATRSFSQIGYPSDLLAQDGLGPNHHSISGNHNLSVVRNGEQGLQESRSPSISQPLGMSGTSHTASFSKLLNNFKTNLPNQQAISMGAEKVFPSVFESFRPPVGGPGNNVQSFLPRSDGQLKFSMMGKPTVSMRTQPYRPCIINSQQAASVEELPKQENSFEQRASDKVGSIGISAQQTSTRALPVTVPTLLVQTSGTSPQFSMLQSQGQDQRKFLMAKIHSGTSTAVTPPLHSVLHTYHQVQTKPADGQDSHAHCLSEKQQSDSCSDGPAVSQASEPSDPPRQLYLLSDQMLATAMQNDADNKAVKRLKIADAMGSGSGSSFKGKASDQTIYPHIGQDQAKVATATSTAPWRQDSFPANARMLPSSQGSKERNEATPNQSIAALMQSRIQQGYNHIIFGSPQSSSGGSDPCQVNPQLVNSRLLQFGTNTNEQLMALQVAAMYKRLGGSGRSAMISSQQFLPGRKAESLFPGAGLVPNITGHLAEPAVKDAGPIPTVQNSTVATLAPTEDLAAQQHFLSKSSIRPPPTILPKKRKKVVSRLIPWHIEITQTGGWLPTTSDAELAWASATNRLPEKEEDGIDAYEEGTGSITRVKRRLKLTTQLMQQLIPPLPAAIVRGKANIEHENATYTLAKTALADACKLISHSRKDRVPDRGNEAENESLAFGQLQKPKRLKGNSILRIVEGFMDRARNLDNELLRLEASISMTELRSETQDLERVSIMNRLVKHHGRNIPADPAKVTTEEKESSSESALCTRKLCPQRYVTAVPMPRNLPEGVLCYSL